MAAVSVKRSIRTRKISVPHGMSNNSGNNMNLTTEQLSLQSY